MAEWRDCRLGDLLQIKHGFAFLGEHFASAGTHVVLTPGNFLEEGGFKQKSDKVKWYKGPIPSHYVLNEGDLIVAMTEQAEGLLGSSALIPRSGVYLHNQRLGLVQIRDRKQADQHFIYYLFNSKPVRQQIRASASGAKVRHTAPSRIADVKVSVPPLPVQRRIAGILSAYDDLIENNTRRIAILDEMARALYREWFIHFRFPGHEKVKIVESPLGPIPQGWQPKRVSDVATIHRGRSYKSENLVAQGGLPFLNLKCINREGGFRRDGVKHYDGPHNDTQTAIPGDIVVAVTDMTQERRIVARAARVPAFAEGTSVFSMDLVKLVAHGSVASEYLYGMLRFSQFSDEVKQHANGVNVLHLNPARISGYAFPLPIKSLRDAYAAVAGPAYQEADLLERTNDNLRNARDLLLPKLISGEIDVSNVAEAPLEATA